LVAIFNGRLEHYGFVEAMNVFLFNVVLCYFFRIFHTLWLSTAFSISIYMTAFFSRLPVRELSFIERPNMLTGLERSWFGSEMTVFAGLPITLILTIMLFFLYGLVKHRKVLPIPDELDYPDEYVRGRQARRIRNDNQWIG